MQFRRKLLWKWLWNLIIEQNVLIIWSILISIFIPNSSRRVNTFFLSHAKTVIEVCHFEVKLIQVLNHNYVTAVWSLRGKCLLTLQREMTKNTSNIQCVLEFEKRMIIHLKCSTKLYLQITTFEWLIRTYRSHDCSPL